MSDASSIVRRSERGACRASDVASLAGEAASLAAMSAASSSRARTFVHLTLIAMLAGALDLSYAAVNRTETKHDLPFHASNVRDYLRSWREGVAYPRWAASCNNGLGSPNFVFYPPLVYSLSGLFGLMGCDLATSIRLCVSALAAARGAAMYGWLRSRRLDERAALMAALAYMALPYPTINVFRRAALAETAAFVWFPLILWGCDELRERFSTRFVLAWAGLLVTHLLSMLMLFPLAAFYFLARGPRDVRTLGRATFAIALGSLLAAVFVLPAVLELAHTAIPRNNAATGSFLGIHWNNSFLFDASQQPLDWQQFNWTVSSTAIVQMACAWLACAILLTSDPDGSKREAADRRNDRWRRVLTFAALAVLPFAAPWGELAPSCVEWPLAPLAGAIVMGAIVAANVATIVLAARCWNVASSTSRLARCLAAAVVLSSGMMNPLSTPLWKATPKLAALQFPWRWNGLLSLAAAVLVGQAIVALFDPKRTIPRTLKVAFAAAVLAAGGLSLWFVGVETDRLCTIDTYDTVARYGKLTLDYIPVAGYDQFVDQLPRYPGEASLRAGRGRVTTELWNSHERRLRVEADEPVSLAVHLFWFPGWSATASGRPVALRAEPETGLVRLDLPAGEHDVRLRFGDTPVRQAGLGLSLAALATLLVWRRTARRLPLQN